MAGYTTGAEWSFPADLPGSFAQEQDHVPKPSESPHDAHSDSPSPAAEEDPKPKPRRSHWPPRQCRICLDIVQPTFHYDTDSPLPAALQPSPRVTYDSDGGRLLSPCRCRGSQKYVHEVCLNSWRKADPTQNRNYWECPTCRYRYHLQRLTWSACVSSTTAQVGLTLLIFIASTFLLGFVADPIINLYLNPVDTIASVGGPTGSLLHEDEPTTWFEHMLKGLASLGLLGFFKFIFTLSPFQWFRTGGIYGRSTVSGSGRDRLQQLSWITLLIGICTFLWAVWKGVRAWSRRTLETAGERVLDVPGQEDLEDEDD